MQEMWSVPEKGVPLRRQRAKATDIESLKAAYSPVDHARSVPRVTGREVVPLHQGHRQTPQRCVARHRDSRNAAPDDDHVELLGRQRLEISLHSGSPSGQSASFPVTCSNAPCLWVLPETACKTWHRQDVDRVSGLSPATQVFSERSRRTSSVADGQHKGPGTCQGGAAWALLSVNSLDPR